MRTNNGYKVTVNLIRHGKTLLNEKHCYIGVIDDSLSENGRVEIEEKVSAKIYREAEICFVSPMRRAIETADIIYPDVQKIIIEKLKEMNFGSFEGKNYEQLKDNLFYRRWIDESRGFSVDEINEIYGDLVKEPIDNIVLPEKKSSFSKRVIEGFEEILFASKDKEEIAIVAHGGDLMAIMEGFSGEEYYNGMASCGEGFLVEIEYMENDGNIEITRFGVIDRIRA